MTKDQDNVSGS